jgi:hypothetical protein
MCLIVVSPSGYAADRGLVSGPGLSIGSIEPGKVQQATPHCSLRVARIPEVIRVIRGSANHRIQSRVPRSADREARSVTQNGGVAVFGIQLQLGQPIHVQYVRAVDAHKA